MKRFLDIIFAIFGLTIMSPILIFFILAVWLQDFKSPFYIAPRVGKGGRIFNMVKLRSMVVNADKSGVDSTSTNDMRITAIGKIIRKYKLDELSQLWNVLCGDMSFVGPRPNVKREVDLYTSDERRLLDVRPGITDFSSIVFSDEGEILAGSDDPDIEYNQIIRPWKSRLGLLYVQHAGFLLDIQLIFFTVIAFFSRKKALSAIQKLLTKIDADKMLVDVAGRTAPLVPFPPPGSNEIVRSRNMAIN